MSDKAYFIVSKVRFMIRVSVFSAALALVASGLCAAQPAVSEPRPSTCAGASGASLPTIIELYTSEGCDSCPPADRWLSKTIAERSKEATFIPLAFHVDYWDYIGWKDVFAQPAFAQRQSLLAGNGGASGVYTPQIFVNGKDDRSWKGGAARLGAGGKAATIKFTAATTWRDDGLNISGKLAEPSTNVRLRYAVTENGLVSAVKAGENRGVTLRHDAVVRAHGTVALDGTGAFALNVRLPKEVRRNASQLHVIAEDSLGKPLAAATI